MENPSTKSTPEVFYGVFKIRQKEFEEKYRTYLIRTAISNNECDLIIAYPETFKEEKDAAAVIPILPKPGMYVILPVYISI